MSMSAASASHTVLYVVSIWTDCYFHNRRQIYQVSLYIGFIPLAVWYWQSLCRSKSIVGYMPATGYAQKLWEGHRWWYRCSVTFLGTWPTFLFFSWPLCTYTITWPRLTWLITCTPEPLYRELHCSLLLYVSYCSLFMVVCDHHCSWLHCSVMSIVCDSIVLSICTLSQIAALLYIS